MTSPLIDVAKVLAGRNLLAKNSFRDFCRVVDIPGAPVEDDDAMLLPAAWDRPIAAHHDLIMDKLQQVEEGKIRRIMFFMPPGSAKSTYGSVLFPAWFLGRKRGRTVVCATYNSELAATIGENTRSVASQGIFSDIFGANTVMSGTTNSKDEWKLQNGNGYYAGGFISGITGRRADLVVVDDPIKNMTDADSPATRNKVWNEWLASITTRAKPDCRYVIIQTRWHEDDLAGRILPQDYKGESGPILCQDGEIWEVVNIPAEAYLPDDPLGREAGELLWPEWFPASHWNQYRKSGRVWNALYQQRPSGDAGTEFKAEWFQGGSLKVGDETVEFQPTMFDPAQKPAHLNIYMTSDHARRESARSDYNVFRIWGVDPEGDIWLLDSVRRKGDLPSAMGVINVLGTQQIADTITNRGALALIRKWKPKKWFPESDPSWQVSEPLIRTYLRDFGLWIQIDEKSTRVRGAVGKVEKARPYIEMCSMGKVHLPSNEVGYDTIKEYISFPAGSHDDQVDADAMMGRVLGEYQKALIPPGAKPIPMSGYKKTVQRDRHSQRGLF